MGDLMKPLTTVKELPVLLLTWGIPTFAASGIFLVTIYQQVKNVYPILNCRRAFTHAGVDGLWVAVAVAAVITLTLSFSSRAIYQVLEGYRLWPGRLRNRRTQTHQAQWDVLKAEDDETEARLELDDARQASAGSEIGYDQAVLHAGIKLSKATTALADARKRRNERLWIKRKKTARQPIGVLGSAGYPGDRSEVRPTKLGNRIRRFENYGIERYGLDVLALWYEMTSVVPKELKNEIDDAQRPVDFFVCWTALAGIFSLCSVAAIVIAAESGTGSVFELTVYLTVAILIAMASYRMSVDNVDDWAVAIQAVVNTGRIPLAKAYGLILPCNNSGEKRMWQALGGFVAYGSAGYAARLDDYRSTGSTGSTVAIDAGAEITMNLRSVHEQ